MTSLSTETCGDRRGWEGNYHIPARCSCVYTVHGSAHAKCVPYVNNWHSYSPPGTSLPVQMQTHVRDKDRHLHAVTYTVHFKSINVLICKPSQALCFPVTILNTRVCVYTSLHTVGQIPCIYKILTPLPWQPWWI